MSYTVTKAGDMFASNCEALVNPVNCVGDMGAGLAKKFADTFPIMNEDYKRYCAEGLLRPGMIHTYYSNIEANPWIVNFPTKDHWKDPSRLEYIATGMNALLSFVRRVRIKSIAIPALGCGLGGLDWNQVEQYIRLHADALPDVDWIVYAPK